MTEELDFLPDETWREVPGSEGHYEVSNHGRVRGWYYLNTGKKQPSPRLRKPRISEKGYVFYSLRIGGKEQRCYSHRLVMLAFVGKSSLEVNHIDGDKGNNQLSNLEYCTHKENQSHARETLGRQMGPKGETHPRAKISDAQVAEIRQLASEGVGYPVLATKYGLRRDYVSKLVRGKYRRNDTTRYFLNGAK